MSKDEIRFRAYCAALTGVLSAVEKHAALNPQTGPSMDSSRYGETIHHAAMHYADRAAREFSRGEETGR